LRLVTVSSFVRSFVWYGRVRVYAGNGIVSRFYGSLINDGYLTSGLARIIINSSSGKIPGT
jgi:hypothetical protein